MLKQLRSAKEPSYNNPEKVSCLFLNCGNRRAKGDFTPKLRRYPEYAVEENETKNLFSFDTIHRIRHTSPDHPKDETEEERTRGFERM